MSLSQLRADNLSSQYGDEGNWFSEEGSDFFELGSWYVKEDRMAGIWGLEIKKSISSKYSGAALKDKEEDRIKSFTSCLTLVTECCEVWRRY